MRTQVAIIGAGPAGLLLAQLLRQRGIDSVVLEARSRHYIENRVRAGVLEHQSVDILKAAGVGERLQREGLLHHGFHIHFGARRLRIDLADLTGHGVTIYGQQEVVRDLVAARVACGEPILFEAGQVSVAAFDGEPRVHFQHAGMQHTLECDFIAGCDGFHGVCRASAPADKLALFERVYPFAWLGILAEVSPASEELIYANHDRGFALLSMRSPTVSRLYLQCAPDEDPEPWTDAGLWSELSTRLGLQLPRGPILHKSVTPMRSFVAEPLRFGRMFLAGDAAHIVPPTGAKGMNLAIADVSILATALEKFYRAGRWPGGAAAAEGLAAYSSTCLNRVWKVQRFSWWLTTLLHRFAADTPFDRRRQLAELEYIATSRAAAQTVAENYVGLPLA